jgi:hypothetical protein
VDTIRTSGRNVLGAYWEVELLTHHVIVRIQTSPQVHVPEAWSPAGGAICEAVQSRRWSQVESQSLEGCVLGAFLAFLAFMRWTWLSRSLLPYIIFHFTIVPRQWRQTEPTETVSQNPSSCFSLAFVTATKTDGYYYLQQLHYFALLPAMLKDSSFSTSFPTLVYHLCI